MASGIRFADALTKFLPSQRRKQRGCEQVAAVCFRFAGGGIEFLLVRTRGGRWTFPKGRTEPGLTHAQAAAMEAFEEAGVHGRIEEASFACYRGRKRVKGPEAVETRLMVYAHLCEVSRLGTPQESNRTPTWFSPDKAKRRLQEGRTAEDSAELARIVERAIARIQRLRNGSGTGNDSLHKVQFEARQDGRIHVQQASHRHIDRQDGPNGYFAAVALAVDAYLCKALRLPPSDPINDSTRLLSGDNNNRRSGKEPDAGISLRLVSAHPAMPLTELCEQTGPGGPGQLHLISPDSRQQTGRAGRRHRANRK